MKKIIFVMVIVTLLSLGLVNAVSQQELTESKSLIDSKADCKNLSDSQLEIIGEYYMEQMHPGDAHELMHKMMGLEDGSDAEKQFHINMAKRLYCNENIGGMMGGMMGMMGEMMGNNPTGFGYGGYGGFWNPLFWAGVVLLVIWLVYRAVMRRNSGSDFPIDILARRYANGEITKKQFEEMKKTIRA